MTSPWGTPQEPQAGDRFKEIDAWNRRLIIRPIEYIPDMPKLDTRGDALKLNVVDLDDERGPQQYRGILWFSGPLVGTFKGAIGTPFLGYITKEKNTKGYMAWKFYDLANDAGTDAAAQAYLAMNPDFLAPLVPAQTFGTPDTSHHERGPAPEWAGAVPQRPAGPPAPPAPPRVAPGGGYNQAPPPQVPGPRPAPVSGPPAPPVPADGAGIMDRLRRQAGIAPAESNVGSGDQEPPY